MADTQESFPQATTGAGVTVGVQITGSGVTVGTGAYEYNLALPFGESVTITATPVDANGIAQAATVTAVSYNGTPTETGAPSVNTAFPQPNGGGQQYGNAPNQYNPGGDVTGVYPTSNIASINATAPFVVEANNNGSALIEFTAEGGRTGRLNVTVVNPVA